GPSRSSSSITSGLPASNAIAARVFIITPLKWMALNGWRSGGGITQHQPNRTAQHKIVDVTDWIAAGQFNVMHAWQQVGQCDLHLRASQSQPEARVHTITECHMARSVCADTIELERIGFREKVFISIGRCQIYQQQSPRWHCHATDLHIPCR